MQTLKTCAPLAIRRGALITVTKIGVFRLAGELPRVA